MSTPLQYYNSIPPVTKMYAAACLFSAGAYELGLYNYATISLLYSDVFKRFQVWRLFTPFFFIGSFSLTYAFRLVTILLYGAQLERGPFDKRTADLVWMYFFGAVSLLVIACIPYFWAPFLGPSLIYVMVYVWGREFPNARVNIHGLFELKGFYIAWYMLAADMVLGNPLKQSFMGIAAGHFYYFLTVLYPLSSGRNILKTPKWVHKLVAHWGEGYQMNSPFRNSTSSSELFRGRSRWLGGERAAAPSSPATTFDPAEPPSHSRGGDGVAFRGRSRRLGTG